MTRTATPTQCGRQWVRRSNRQPSSMHSCKSAGRIAVAQLAGLARRGGWQAQIFQRSFPGRAFRFSRSLGNRDRSSLMNRKWYYVAMVAVAIAISYFDRQTLPVAISAIQRNIPLSNQQFSYLQTAFLLAYAALYMLGGRLLDLLGTRKGFSADHGLVVARLRDALARNRFLAAAGSAVSARCGRRRCVSRSHARRRRVDRAERTLDRDGAHQRGNSSGLGACAAAYRCGASY